MDRRLPFVSTLRMLRCIANLRCDRGGSQSEYHGDKSIKGA